MISHEKTKRHNNSSAFLTMIVKRVTGTHSSIIMAINKLYGWSLRSLSVGRDQVFYICSEYMVYYYTRDDREVAGGM